MIDTVARRNRIEKLVGNRFPDCHAIFMDTEDGSHSFRIQAKNGKFRAGAITLLGHHTHVRLNSAWLDEQIARHGGPDIH